MTDPDRDSDPRRDANDYPGVPTWVKIFGIAAVLALLLIVILLLGKSGHGPRRHFGAGDALPEAHALSATEGVGYALTSGC